ncbi:hypothetical protein RRG08_033254 [Elysia crispata]|uniref:Uncharacterized protein n=1 Tax=Elysia crispata TaxID=231223 RepID=A0AAE1DE68_9GAST|nr:hypothetical protein RRG08_033254 [Elysia crispata]
MPLISESRPSEAGRKGRQRGSPDIRSRSVGKVIKEDFLPAVQDSMDRDVFYLVEGLSSDDPEIIMSSSWSQPPSPKSLSQGMLIGQELGGDARGIQQSYWPFMFVIRSI